MLVYQDLKLEIFIDPEGEKGRFTTSVWSTTTRMRCRTMPINRDTGDGLKKVPTVSPISSGTKAGTCLR